MQLSGQLCNCTLSHYGCAMLRWMIPLFALAAPAIAHAAEAPPPSPGIYTNEEDVYFTAERGDSAPPWTGVEIAARPDGVQWRPIDRFAAPLGTWRTDPLLDGRASITETGALTLTLADGSATELRPSRSFTCWMSVKKDVPKADGSEDWDFVRGLKTHDQGGRTRAGGGDSGAPEAIIRLRNVIWPAPTTNRPSLVIYVFRPEDPNRAVSYSWADPDAKRIGINLRWMQASCTRDGSE
ncbi:MAG: hypothetical protein RLZZ58_607 [Pseudomonadota bacterium]